jgi:hypothetical protein
VGGTTSPFPAGHHRQGGAAHPQQSPGVVSMTHDGHRVTTHIPQLRKEPTLIDFANLRLDAMQLRALMQTDGSTPVIYNGRSMLLQDALAARMRGDGQGVDIQPAQPAPVQPGQAAGPGIRISQAAVEALSPAQYEELKTTGHLQGVTNSENGRAIVHVTTGGSYTSQHSFNQETGVVEPGRGVDLRDFYPDDVADGDQRYAHVARRPQPDAQK